MNTVIACLTALLALGTFELGEAAEAKRAGKASQTAQSASGLPNCVNDPAQLSAIDDHRKQNSKNEFKYAKIREALISDSDEELVARLAYAETLAANCPEFQKEVLYPIVRVIQNRIAKRKGDVKSVVFQRDQFASSLNGYDDSKWREFLCPTDPSLWQTALRAARAYLPNGGSMITNMSTEAFNYYLFRHSSKFSPPDWAKKEALGFSNAKKVEGCFKIFRAGFK